jgi:hypothetical protein
MWKTARRQPNKRMSTTNVDSVVSGSPVYRSDGIMSLASTMKNISRISKNKLQKNSMNVASVIEHLHANMI